MRIVVGIDFGASGDLALRDALRLLEVTPTAELHPVYVMSLTEGSEALGLDALSAKLSDTTSRLERHIDAIVAQAASAAERRASVAPAGDSSAPDALAGAAAIQDGDREMCLHVRLSDDVADALVQVAVDVEAQLIVVGTRERGRVSRLILGSVAEALVHHAPLPILVARPTELRDRPKTPRPEPGRPGEDLHARRLGWTSSRLSFRGRGTQKIAGLV